MLRRAVLLCCTIAALTGCASAPPAPPPAVPLFEDQAFAPPSQRISAADVFAVSEPMRRFLASDGASSTMAQPDPRRRLMDGLFRKRDIVLQYDATSTRNAAEAFDERSGNCLSLVIMTAALAKSIGVPVQYQSVVVDETWSRNGGVYFSAGHVNLLLGWSLSMARIGRGYEQPLIVDFLPPDAVRGRRVRPIAESTVVAMFMNNRAAEAMVRDRIDDAYWWAREAIVQDPGFLAAYNTLGVVYERHGRPAAALQAFEYAYQREPENTKVIGNLARAYRAQGRTADADRLERKLAQIEPYPPFHFFDAGLAAMRAHDYAGASELFLKEIKREPDYHEFHFWLAQAQFALGNVRDARKHLEQALQSSTTVRDHDIYAAKLDWLRGQRAQ